MRPLIALLITVVLIGGTFAYTRFVQNIKREKPVVQTNLASGEYEVHIWRTFDCMGSEEFEIESLLVQFEGRQILRRTDLILQTEEIRVGPLEGVQQLANELLVLAQLKSGPGGGQFDDEFDGGDAQAAHSDEFANFESTDSTAASPHEKHALRVMVIRDDRVIADQSFWLPGGSQSIGGTVQFNAPLESQVDEP